MDMMAAFPKAPKSSHERNISVVTVSSVERSRVDHKGPAGRTETIITAGRRLGIELAPRPSDKVDDPVVRLSSGWNHEAR
jgi:hypothetical protein